MSTAPAHLRIEPNEPSDSSGPQGSPSPPVSILPRPLTPEQAEARARFRERVRRFFTVAGFTAVAIPPAAVLAGPAIGEGWVAAAMGFCYVMVVAPSGMVLLVYAAVQRTGSAVRTLLAAVLALAASVALLPSAGTIAQEAALDRNAAELEVIAADIVRGGPALAGQLDGRPWERTEPPPAEVREAAARLLERMDALGIGSVVSGDGYLLFRDDAPFAPERLYATGGRVPAVVAGCARPEMRYAGGRWYLFECGGAVESAG